MKDIISIVNKYKGIDLDLKETMKIYDDWDTKLGINLDQFVDIFQEQYNGSSDLCLTMLEFFKTWE